jgi:hypothetical protein
MKKISIKIRKIMYLLILFLGLCPLISCFSWPEHVNKKYLYLNVPESTSTSLLDVVNQEDCFTYQLSEDETYYILTGISEFGKALYDLNESKIYTQNLSDQIFSIGWSQSNQMGFDVTIPSTHLDLPVKELGPNSLSYLAYYSFHLTIPESITKIDTNAIVCSYSSLETYNVSCQLDDFKYEIDPSDVQSSYHNQVVDSIGYERATTKYPYRDVFAPSSITWNIGEEDLTIEPYAIRLSTFFSKPCEQYLIFLIPDDYFRPVYFDINVSPDNSKYTFEDTILYNKDKTKVIYGYDFSNWMDDEDNLIIPDNVEEIGDGSFALSSFTTSCNCIRIGKNLKKLSTYFFDHPMSGKTEFTSIEVDSTNESFVFENNMLLNKDKTKLYYAFLDNNDIELPTTIQEVGSMIYAKEGKVNIDGLNINLLPCFNTTKKEEENSYTCAIERTKPVSFDEENFEIHGISLNSDPFDWKENAKGLSFTEEELVQKQNIVNQHETISVNKEYRTYYFLVDKYCEKGDVVVK